MSRFLSELDEAVKVREAGLKAAPMDTNSAAALNATKAKRDAVKNDLDRLNLELMGYGNR